jgi:hypothetical protein
MHRLTRLFIAVLISVAGLTAGSIDFSGVTDAAVFGSAADSGVTVDFFTLNNGLCLASGPCAPTGSAYGAISGAPTTAFLPDDVRAGGGDGDGFLTDEPDGPSPQGPGAFTEDYLLRFDKPVHFLSLDILDYRNDGGPSVGAQAFLEVFSTNDWDPDNMYATPLSAIFTLPGGTPDGIVVNLVNNAPGGILSARVRFSQADVGTGIDNVEWAEIPEPGTVALFGSGLLALAAFARRRRTRS